MSEFWLVDALSTYLYFLRFIALVLAFIILVSSIDDLFIDIVYWSRQVWRKTVIYRKYKHLDYQTLYEVEEKPLAIMVPAWNETGVIGKMAELAATRFDYENYQIFVGTYPNDPETQKDVDEVCARFPNIHKIVCARPGPTSKADCLNNVLDAIFRFEKQAGISFAGFVLHDAEDFISELELRLFNFLVERKDLIQIPVYPFERPWTHFTALHYLDEFAENHGKDIPVREWLVGQVPSAGVGTCFSRRAILALLEEGDGIAFDIQSLTEDYDIGLRLKKKGMREIFVRFPVIRSPRSTPNAHWSIGMHNRVTNVICVREYFPETFTTAVRQKTRWIIGIIYQGFKNLKWSDNWMLNYFLWRDRKGAVTNFASFAATLVLLQLIPLAIYQIFWPDAYQFLSIFMGSPLLIWLLWINSFLLLNRVIQRVIFVSSYYGITQGLMSLLRLFWANFINFSANCRALYQVIALGDPRRVAWDKTSHDFPSIGGENRARRPLGEILISQGSLNQTQLSEAITSRPLGLKLGSWLVHENIITSEQLAAGMAEQSGVPWESIDAYQIPDEIIARIPAHIALHYGILPLRQEEDHLLLASESYVDPVSLNALSRKVKSKLAYVITLKGQVTMGLRYWYARGRRPAPRRLLQSAQKAFNLSPEQCEQIWKYFLSRQLLLGEVIMTLARIDEATMKSFLLQHEHSDLQLAPFLIQKQVISETLLAEAFEIIEKYQVSMPALLRQAGISEAWLADNVHEAS